MNKLLLLTILLIGAKTAAAQTDSAAAKSNELQKVRCLSLAYNQGKYGYFEAGISTNFNEVTGHHPFSAAYFFQRNSGRAINLLLGLKSVFGQWVGKVPWPLVSI